MDGEGGSADPVPLVDKHSPLDDVDDNDINMNNAEPNAMPLPGEDDAALMSAANSEHGQGLSSAAGFSSAPPSPGFRPGDSPGPSRSHRSFTPLRPSGGSQGALDRGTTPLPRADLGTHQRSSVRRSRPRGQLPPVSPAHPSLHASASVGPNSGRGSGLPPPSSPMRSPGPPSSSVIAATPLGGYHGGMHPPSSSFGADHHNSGLLHNSVIPPSELDVPSQISQMGNNGNMGGGAMSEGDSAFSGSNNSELDTAVLWGTNISVREAMRKFRRFLNEFLTEGQQRRSNHGGDDDILDGLNDDGLGGDGAAAAAAAAQQPYYMRLLAEIRDSQTFNINIDCQNLYNFTPTRRLYQQLVRYPQEIVPIMDLVVHQEYTTLFGQDALQNTRIQVRTFNLLETKTMRDLNPQDIDQMVSVKGMITRTSGVIPDIKMGFFKCTACGNTAEVMIDRGKIQEPDTCTGCQAKRSMSLVHNRCWFADKQMIKLQEAPENIAEGETPTTVTLYSFDDLVDVGRPGDRVQVTGIFRAVPIRANPRRRSVQSVYKTYIDVIHFRKAAKGRLSAESTTAEENSEAHTTFDEGDETEGIRETRRLELEALSRDPDVYDKLTVSSGEFGVF
jgi:hypothetical protein